MKILLGIPTTGQFDAEFVSRLNQIRSKKHQIDHIFIVKSIIHIARENIVNTAIGQGYDAVVFLDDDMIIEPDFIDRLAAHPEPIVSALCVKRVPPYTPCVYFDIAANGFTISAREAVFDEYPTKPFYVDAAGAACMLIRTEVFKKMQKPWFLPLPYSGEDLSFCLRLRQTGISILVDPTIKVGHLETRAVYLDHYLEWRRSHDNDSRGSQGSDARPDGGR